ncbi:MAG TPA: hypothetical protein VMV94_12075, partial [Phycisphaerae bacterium]|nr:hypothetical protein [Phycisphaerae bacterium]
MLALTPHSPPNLILAAADWGYLVALLIFSIVSWIANSLKKRQEEAAKKKPTSPARRQEEPEEEEVEPAELLGPEESAFPFPGPFPPPPIRRAAERPPSPLPAAPPIAAPAARPAMPAPRETRVKQPRQRVILAESPTPRASDLETPVKLPIARAADIKPLARAEDMVDAFGHPSRAAVQERLNALASAEMSTATSGGAALALLRQLRTPGSPLPRQAILLSEVLAPPIALRHQTPGLPPLNDV